MVSRVEQKRQTRRRLLKAALSQLGEDRSFSTLSLREVAREAGIAPTSFYRHFQDMDELERFAREEKYFKRANEDVFVITTAKDGEFSK